MGRVKKHEGNYLEEMRELICEIDDLKPEPEICNVSCPPFGCPLGPCPGLCCTKGICDSCCVSKMPASPIPTCPARSSPAHTYTPPACSLASATPYSNFPNNNMTANGQQYSQSSNCASRNRISNIAVCQVPSTRPVQQARQSYCSTASHGQQNFAKPQSCSSVIEMRYPEIIPHCFPPQSFASKLTHQQMRSTSCPPPYYTGAMSAGQQNNRPGRLPGRQICPPNSPYIVTIPYRKMA